jgi:peptidoglycan/LPS O-acetylase OafA/YrhL
VRSQSHLPGLDGLRGVSIALVLLGHLSLSAGSPRWMQPLASVSPLGVTMFFVLSGFLITRLLLRERTIAGRISLGRFVARRALRIVPASYFYVGFIALLAGLRVLTLKRHDVSCALLYVMDFHHDRAWYLGHYWSLSVEEQFYLVWPPILALLSARAAVVAALVILALAELVPMPNGTAPIAIGCLLALHFDRLTAMRFWRSGVWPLALIFVEVLQLHLQVVQRQVLGMQLVLELLVAVVILRTVNTGDDFLGTVLASPVAVTLGALSYSLYLWQQLFLGRSGDHWFTTFPVNLLAVMAAATASYLLIERPFLRLKARFVN